MTPQQKTILKKILLTHSDNCPALTCAAQEKLIQFIELLHKWNKIHNLTGIKDPVTMLKRHVLESLYLLPYITEGPVIDVGTGAGVPGIPLAILRPEQTFVLLDSRQKKINFIQHVVLSLGLKNVVPVCERVQSYSKDEENRFQWVISRAFAELSQFIISTAHLLKPSTGRFLAIRGGTPVLASLPKGFTIEHTEVIKIGDNPKHDSLGDNMGNNQQEAGIRTLIFVRQSQTKE